MVWSHRMGIRGLLIAGFLVVAPLVAVFQGPLQDRLETLFKRNGPNTSTVATTETWVKPTDAAAGFRPVVRGDSATLGDGAMRRPRFPDEPEEPQPGDVAEQGIRTDDPRSTPKSKRAAAPDSPLSDDGNVVGRLPVRKNYDGVQSNFQTRDDEAGSSTRKLVPTERDDPPDEDRTTEYRKPAQGKLPGKGRDDRHDLTVAEDDVMEKAGGGRKAAASDPLARPYAKLRDLGATSSRLETWGAEGDRYRFQCRVATDVDETEARHFEATDEQPLRAIEKVVQQVEVWQGQRR